MAYIVYHKETTERLDVHVSERRRMPESYATERAAKAALTRAVKKYKINGADFAIAEKTIFYRDIEKQVEKVNLLSGTPFKIGVNTPRVCDPSTETYWSF